jgi:pimeloyl-ACP methyl ester carboxylesterase
VIGPLTDPAAHGGDPADAFHVVAPPVPGFGFSRPVEEAGWALSRTASAFAELMRRLGDDRYAAHGGDIGAGVSGMLGGVDAEHVVGTHVNADPTALARIEGLPDDVSGFTDEWADPTVEPPDGAVDRDQLLTNVRIYWFTGTGASAAQFIYEATHASDWPPPSSVPQGWAVFADDGIIRRVVDPGAQIEHWSEFDRGGHLPAMEVPDLLVGDVRTFFRRVR